MTTDNLMANRRDLDALKQMRPLLDKQYVFFQEMRAYVNDFVDCYNEKIVEIENAEIKWLLLYKQRADRLAATRHQNVRDQNIEATNCESTT